MHASLAEISLQVTSSPDAIKYVNSTLSYTEPQVEQAAKLRKSHEMDYLSSGRGNRVYLGGFSLNLFEEISRVMLGNRFDS